MRSFVPSRIWRPLATSIPDSSAARIVGIQASLRTPPALTIPTTKVRAPPCPAASATDMIRECRDRPCSLGGAAARDTSRGASRRCRRRSSPRARPARRRGTSGRGGDICICVSRAASGSGMRGALLSDRLAAVQHESCKPAPRASRRVRDACIPSGSAPDPDRRPSPAHAGAAYILRSLGSQSEIAGT